MGGCYSKEAYEEVVTSLQEQKKKTENLEKGNATLKLKVQQLERELNEKSKAILALESTLNEAICTNEENRNKYNERIKKLEWNFNDTISKLCDMQIAELTQKGRLDNSNGLNTKTTATEKVPLKKERRLPSLRNLFVKKPSPNVEVQELKKKVKVLEIDKQRQLHRKENELSEQLDKTSTLKSKLKNLEMTNNELKESVPTPCTICLENPTDCTFLPCGHLCTCMTCSKRITSCPLCRGAISQKVKVFKS